LKSKWRATLHAGKHLSKIAATAFGFEKPLLLRQKNNLIFLTIISQNLHPTCNPKDFFWIL